MKNLIDVGWLTDKDYQDIVMLLNEIKESGVPFHFEQCECFLCKGKKDIYIENIKGQRIFLNYNDKFQEWYLQSYIVMNSGLNFEGGYKDFIELFKKNVEFFSPSNLIMLEETIVMNGDTIEELGLSELFDGAIDFYQLGRCTQCSGVTYIGEKDCDYCKTNKKKKNITLWQREIQKRKA